MHTYTVKLSQGGSPTVKATSFVTTAEFVTFYNGNKEPTSAVAAYRTGNVLSVERDDVNPKE